MSLHSLPVAQAPAAAPLPAARTVARAAGAEDAPRFADLVGGFVDEGPAAPAAAAAEGPRVPETVPADGPDAQPATGSPEEAATAPPVLPWLVLSTPVPEASGTPAAALEQAGAPAEPGATAAVVTVPAGAAPAGEFPVEEGAVAVAVQPPAQASEVPGPQARPARPADGALAEEAAPAAPHARLAPPADRRNTDAAVVGGSEAAEPAVGGAGDSDGVAAGLLDEAGAGAAMTPPRTGPEGSPDVAARPDDALARFLRRERGEGAPPTAGATRDVQTAQGRVPGPQAVAETGDAAVPSPPAATELPGSLAGASGPQEPARTERPRAASADTSMADTLLRAQRDALAALGAAPSGDGGAGADRQPGNGRTQAAIDALLTHARPARGAATQASAGGPVTAPVVEGLEARFQAWLAQAAAATPAGVTAAPEPADVPGQVIKAMQMQWRDGVGEARVQLRPEHLGAVTVSLRVEQGTVVASVRVESVAALEAIRARQQELQQALEAQGLQVNELEVTLDPEDRRDRPAYRQPEPPRPTRRAQAGQHFEVVA